MRKNISSKVVNLWCHEGNHDKLYRLELQEMDGKCDVFSFYGRRGKKLTMHIWLQGVGQPQAEDMFYQLRRDKLKKGYREIKEDVVDVGQEKPVEV